MTGGTSTLRVRTGFAIALAAVAAALPSAAAASPKEHDGCSADKVKVDKPSKQERNDERGEQADPGDPIISLFKGSGVDAL